MLSEKGTTNEEILHRREKNHFSESLVKMRYDSRSWHDKGSRNREEIELSVLWQVLEQNS